MVIKRVGKYVLELDSLNRYLVLVDVGIGPLFGLGKKYSSFYHANKKFDEIVKRDPIIIKQKTKKAL